MAKPVTYEEFQKMVRLAPPNSGIDAKSIATSLEKKGYSLPPELSQFSSVEPQEKTEGKEGFFSTLSSYLQAPGNVVGGLAEKAAGAVAGKDVSSLDNVKNLSSNLSKSADVVRVGLPIAAGFATGGMSIPASAAISGAVGVGSSLLASGLEGAAGENQTIKGALGEAVTTGAANAILDAATMGLFKAAKLLPKAKGLTELTDDLNKTVGKVVQSNADDIAKGRKAIQSIDVSGVKTYDDLTKTIDAKLSALKTEQNAVLDAVEGAKPVKEFTKTIGEGKNSIKTNAIETALDHLQEVYGKTGAAEDLVRIRDLKELADTQGLTTRQINDLAREYGRGFKTFSSKTGEPLTSVNSQLYENTRKALKEASRSTLPNKAAQTIDDEMTNLIRTRDLTEEMAEKVQNLANKVEMRGAGEKIGALIGHIVNASSFGTFGGLVKGIMPSDVGLKTLNSLRIQENLPKNLAKITKLIEQIDTLPEGAVIGKLKEIFGEAAVRAATSAMKGIEGGATNFLNE